MKSFDSSKSILSAEDLLDGADFVSEFSASLGEYKTRLTGTDAETATARTIRDRLHNETGAKVRLEAYRAQPLIGRGAFPLLGIWFTISLLLYYVSFVGGRVAGVLLSLLALVVFLTGVGVLVSLFLGKRTFGWLFTSSISYNVVSERKAKTEEGVPTRSCVIVDNHDAVLGSYFSDFGSSRKIAFILAPITGLLFILFCILKMAVGSDTPIKISFFTILPTITSVIGIFVILTHFSPFEKHARENNGIGTSVALATYAYFVENSQMCPEDINLVYVSLGGENSAHGGSQAFVKAHPELKGAKVLCIGDILSGKFQVAEFDAIRKIQFSTPLISDVLSSAREQDIDCGKVNHLGFKNKLNSLHGYTSNSFARRGIASTTIIAKDYNVNTSNIDRNDIERLFSLSVGTMSKLFKESAVVDNNEETNESEDNAIESTFTKE